MSARLGHPPTPSFSEGVLVALAGSAFAGAAWAAAMPWMGSAGAARAVIAALGGAYVVYLLARSQVRAGRVAAVLVWGLATAAAAAWEPPLAGHLLVQLALVWLVRSWCYRRGVLRALADLALSVLSLGAALWAARETGSVALSVWSALLVQALFVVLPGAAARAGPASSEDAFERAHRSAEAAAHRLSTGRPPY